MSAANNWSSGPDWGFLFWVVSFCSVPCFDGWLVGCVGAVLPIVPLIEGQLVSCTVLYMYFLIFSAVYLADYPTRYSRLSTGS